MLVLEAGRAICSLVFDSGRERGLKGHKGSGAGVGLAQLRVAVTIDEPRAATTSGARVAIRAMG